MLLAKQAASIHRISDGRFVLGLAVGAREDDYAAPALDFASRGERFERDAERIKSIWAHSGRVPGAAEYAASAPTSPPTRRS